MAEEKYSESSVEHATEEKKESCFEAEWLWTVLSSSIVSLVLIASYHFFFAVPLQEKQEKPIVVDYMALSNAKLAMLTEKVRSSNGTFTVDARELENFITALHKEMDAQAQGRTIFVRASIVSDAVDITLPIANKLGLDLSKSFGSSLERVANDVLNTPTSQK